MDARQAFAPGGPLSELVPGYTPRPQQIEMAAAVDELPGRPDRSPLVIEAPTGVGKSLGYLVPLALARARGELGAVMVATANIALQEQLVNKDLPLVAELVRRATGRELEFALAKGVGNYLCAREYDAARQSLGAAQEEGWGELDAWARATGSGDLSELPFELGPNLRQLVTTTADDCSGDRCAFAGRCHARRVKARLAGADVVVTNYALLWIDHSIRLDSDGAAGALPPYDALVMDEAHKAADTARDAHGARITEGSIRHNARLLAPRSGRYPALDSDLLLAIEREARALFGAVATFAQSEAYRSRIRPRDRAPDPAALCQLLERAATVLSGAAARGDADYLQKLRSAARRLGTIAANLTGILAGSDEEACWIDLDRRGRAALRAAPLRVGEVLGPWLAPDEDAPATHARPGRPPRIVVVTSATLRDGERFDHVRAELGLGRAGRDLAVDSPFDWSRVALVVPSGPPASSREFRSFVSAQLGDLVRALGGRVLGLFTSHAGLQQAARVLRGCGVPVLVQGDAPRTQLVEQFRREERTVLLGTESFWAGVDVPGPSLSAVLIDKLPFAPPDDPIVDMLGRDSFYGWSLPRAVIQLRQGFGRLVRRDGDRGLVVLCDDRVITKGYGQRFLAPLPEVALCETIEDGLEVAGIAPARQASIEGLIT